MALSSIYLLSSLPGLRWLEKPPVSSETFLSRVEKHLSGEAFSMLQCIKSNQWEGIKAGFAQQWNTEEVALLKTIARERKRRYQTAGNGLPESGRENSESLKVIYATNNPLEREKALDFIRWERALHLSKPDTHGFLALVSYFIRLLLLEKYAALDAASGWQEMSRSTEHVLESAQNELSLIR